MKYLYAKFRRLIVALVITIQSLLIVSSSFSQVAAPPALGPGNYHSVNSPQFGVGLLSGFVKTQVAQIVAQANTEIHKQTSTVSVEALPLKVFSPMRVATRYTNRPNQYYATLPFIIAVKVKIPVTSDRMIYIPLDLNVSCEGWQNGKGTIQFVGKTGPPSIEGGNIVEDIIRVRDVIDNQIRNHLTLPGSITIPIANSECVTIGASPSQSVGDPFAFIAYDPPSGRVLPTMIGRATTTIEVTFQKLKRLRARGNGAVLYQPTENIILDTYANFVRHQSATLTMREDDEVTLNMPQSVVSGPTDLLVVIANILQGPSLNPEDSAFDAAQRTANYSPGVHTLTITKVYTEPPNSLHNKPLIIRVPAYELTYNVRVTNPAVVVSR